MDSSKSKSNKIRDIVRLQQILKKWKKVANNASKTSSSTNGATTTTTTTTTTSSTTSSSSSSAMNSSSSSSKSIKFLKRTLSFQDVSGASSSDVVRKGFLAVCVGKEMKRFTIPTEYLRHQAFGILLREAEEEFGFQQEGVLKIPCEVSVFEKIIKLVEEKREVFFLHEFGFSADKDMFNNAGCCSSPSDCDQLSTPHHPQMCT